MNQPKDYIDKYLPANEHGNIDKYQRKAIEIIMCAYAIDFHYTHPTKQNIIIT